MRRDLPRPQMSHTAWSGWLAGGCWPAPSLSPQSRRPKDPAGRSARPFPDMASDLWFNRRACRSACTFRAGTATRQHCFGWPASSASSSFVGLCSQFATKCSPGCWFFRRTPDMRLRGRTGEETSDTRAGRRHRPGRTTLALSASHAGNDCEHMRCRGEEGGRVRGGRYPGVAGPRRC